jgi:putative oxidoreductase
MNLGLLILRLVVGVLFVGHGAQKLFGWFGGYGPEGTGSFFESLGLRPGRLMAIGAGMGEFAGGVLLALGLVTPLVAALLIAVMAVAVATVHWSKGVWATDGGFEYNLVLAAVAFALAGVGAGRSSLDRVFAFHIAGAGWALAALAAGLLGAIVTLAVARFEARRHPGQATPSAA